MSSPTACRTTTAAPSQLAVRDQVGLFEKATIGGLEAFGRAAIALRARVVALATPDPVVTGPPPEWRGQGPVLLVGGFAETGPVLAPMADWLRRLGYDVTTVTTGAGLGCAGATVDALADQLAMAADTAGAPVRVIGHSRGGQFARVAACRAPADVAALLTLGAPFDLYGLRLPMLAQAAALSAFGSLGAPGLATLGCLRGSCCATFRDGLRAPWPDDVPFVSLYSRTDRAVPWRSSHDPHAHNVEVDTSHIGLLLAPVAFSAVAAALSAHAAPTPRAA